MALYKLMVGVAVTVAALILIQGHYLMTSRFTPIRTFYSLLNNNSDYITEDNISHHAINDTTAGILDEVIPPSQKQLDRRAARVKKMKDSKKWQDAINKYSIKHREVCRKWEKIQHHPVLPYCDCIPGNLTGYRDVIFRVRDFDQISADNPHVKPGGHWAPTNCSSRFSLAIIVPFRDRREHLAVLLAQLHPFLQCQMANYTIYVVEQKSPEIFNKAIMMNTGYKYVKETHSPDCVIFHDVDTIPEDDRHIYTCLPDRVLHIGSHLDVRNYVLAYPTSFGGVLSFTWQQFEKVNGFSNIFFGWGGEDDDMGGRVRSARLQKARDPVEVAGYAVVPHLHEAGNMRPANYWKKHKKLPQSRDGLNTLRVKIAAVEKRPLYTWLHVDVLHKVMGR